MKDLSIKELESILKLTLMVPGRTADEIKDFKKLGDKALHELVRRQRRKK